MKICIVSDSHDRADALAQAVREAKAAGAEAVIHCGDLIGAQTIKPALALGLPMHLIHGNNVGDTQALHRQARASGGLVHEPRAPARPGVTAARAPGVLGDLAAMRFEVRELGISHTTTL